jgi:hypothetical protein
MLLLLPLCQHLFECGVNLYCSALTLDAAGSSKMLVDMYQTTFQKMVVLKVEISNQSVTG